MWGRLAENLFIQHIEEKDSNLYKKVSNLLNLDLSNIKIKQTSHKNSKRDINSLKCKSIGNIISDVDLYSNNNIYNFSIKQGNHYNIFSGGTFNILEMNDNYTYIANQFSKKLKIDKKIENISNGLNCYHTNTQCEQIVEYMKMNNSIKNLINWCYGYGFYLAKWYDNDWLIYPILSEIDRNEWIGDIDTDIKIKYPYYINDKNKNKSTIFEIKTYSKLLNKNKKIIIDFRSTSGSIYDTKFIVSNIVYKK